MSYSVIRELRVPLLFVLLALFIIGGCTPREVVQQEAQKPEAPEVAQRPKAPEVTQKTEEVKPETEKITPPAPEIITEKPVTETPVVAKKEAEVKPEVKKIEFSDIHFDFDKYDIREDARPVLERLATWLKENPKARVLIEGHCDERGTNQYNLALGERRAVAAKNYLMTLGIASSRIDTVTYGEERPLCREQTEGCWQLNRRAHFVVHE
ncbi:MAG: peptidoglycan-associated lipoprotein Pal [Thermodesulfovibrionales bacterium]